MSLGVLSASADDMITFQVNADLVRTWQELRLANAARWATHDVYGGKPVKEFLGPGLSKLNLSVRLDSQLGLIPNDELAQMRTMRDTGAVLQFTVGGELVGDFTLEQLDEEHKRWDAGGALLLAIANLTLEEYQ